MSEWWFNAVCGRYEAIFSQDSQGGKVTSFRNLFQVDVSLSVLKRFLSQLMTCDRTLMTREGGVQLGYLERDCDLSTLYGS